MADGERARLWSNGAATDWGVEVVTEGECWTLAYYLHRIGGWPVYWLAPPNDRNFWHHVVVKIGYNKYLDVQGVHSLTELGKLWPGLVPVIVGGPFETWSEYEECLQGDHFYQRPHERARSMAKRLVERYVQRSLTRVS